VPKLPSSSKFQITVEFWLGWGVALALFSMMIITFCDVIGRKFLGSSIPGVVEITELLMLALIFIGLPLCSLRSEHVVFDLLDKFLPAFLAKYVNFISHSACVLLLVGATWLVWERAVRTLSQGDITAQLQIPFAPFYYGTALLLGITSLVHGYLAFNPPEANDDGEISAGAL
jgi:TRAP-type transport system small permease protein